MAFAEITIKYKNKVGPLLYILTIGSLVYTSTRPKTDRPHLYLYNPTRFTVRGAGDCAPYPRTPHGPPPLYIFYIFYTVKFISRRDTQSHAERPPILHSLHG